MSQTSPKVSVLLPVYNGDRYLRQAVESILNQTWADFELLIIDDGSTDTSSAILETYADCDPRIRFTSRENRGLVQTLNELIAQASGEYVARMDADDVALPDRFQQQIQFLETHSEVVCVGGAIELIDEKNRFLTCLNIPETDAEIQQAALAGHGSICHPAAMIRRSALLKAGGYDPSILHAEDLDLWLKLGEIGKLANLPNAVLQYRLHPRSVSEQNQVQQRQSARLACERAWQRRGISGQFEASTFWRPGKARDDRHRFMLQYGWWAFNSGQWQTALVYGMKAIETIPLQIEGWKLAACAILKRQPTQKV